MTFLVNPDSCQKFWPGHHVHWIHARHAWESEGLPATNVFVHNNWIHFTCEGVSYSRWNHNGAKVARLREEVPDGTVTFYKSWRILAVDVVSGGGMRHFVNLDTEPSPCFVGESASH